MWNCITKRIGVKTNEINNIVKRTLLLAIALFMCGVAVSQEKEKKFTLSIQENLLPFGDAGYYIDMYDDANRVPCKLHYVNWLPTF